MTLLIAGLLIYGFGLPWWFYPITLGVWAGRTIWMMRGEDSMRSDVKGVRQELQAMERKIESRFGGSAPHG